MSYNISHVYPAEVYWKKQKVLTLTDSCKITAITKKQYNIIMWVANNRKDIRNWKPTKLAELKDEIYKQRVNYNPSEDIFTVDKVKFRPSDILLIGEEMPSGAQQDRYFRSKVIQEIKYWYHYGKDWYDYFGCGRVEFQAAWHIIQNVIGVKDYYLIFKTK